MSWLDDHEQTNVQTAIQSQAIQTNLEQNTSRITDAGFQSFLQGAPIPRMYYTTNASTFTTGANVTATWTSAGAFDPYGIMVPATGVMTIPIDGFYTGVYWIGATGGAASSLDVGWMDSTKANFYAHDNVDFLTAANTNYIDTTALQRPFRAGDKILVNVGNSTVANLSAITTSCSLVWSGPYNQYTTGQGGN